MAKGFDELLEFLLSEIALCGVQGMFIVPPNVSDKRPEESIYPYTGILYSPEGSMLYLGLLFDSHMRCVCFAIVGNVAARASSTFESRPSHFHVYFSYH